MRASPRPSRRRATVRDEALAAELGAYLGEPEMAALLGRWELVREALRQRIDAFGEDEVIAP